MPKLKNKIPIIIIIMYSLVIGTVAIVVFPEFGGSDANTYDGIAKNIMEKGKFIEVHSQITPPLYPILLSIIYSIFGHHYIAVYIFNILLLTGISIIYFLLAKKHFKLKDLPAIIISLLISAWPYMLLFAMQRLTEIPYIFFLSLAIYNIFEFVKDPNMRRFLFLGLLFALAAHTRPVILFLPLWLWVIALITFLFDKEKKYKLKPILKHGLIGIIFYAILCSPYTIYGSLKTGKLVPIASNISTINNRANISMDKEWYLYGTPGYEPGSEFSYKKLINIKLKNIYRFWDPGADGERAKQVTEKIPLASQLIKIYSFGFYLIVLFFFSSLLYIKKNKNIIILWLILLYFWLLHIALFPFPRYTLPVMPLVITLAVYSLAEALRLLKRGNSTAGPAEKSP